MPKLITLAVGAIVLAAASAALSKDGVPPKIDLQKRCQATQNATDSLTGTKNPDAFDLCLKSEQTARDKLIERWATIPAFDKASCIHPADWSPSYFEWLGCIETRAYARNLRTQQPDNSTPTSALCPMVTWQSDGSIASIATCRLR